MFESGHFCRSESSGEQGRKEGNWAGKSKHQVSNYITGNDTQIVTQTKFCAWMEYAICKEGKKMYNLKSTHPFQRQKRNLELVLRAH